MRRSRIRLTYANVVGSSALFAALGGRDRSLLASDFRAGELVAGPQGPKGDPGPKGDRRSRGGPAMRMKTTMRARALAPLAAVLLAVPLTSATPAHAAVNAGVELNTLKILGDGAGDKLALRLKPGDPATLDVDVGDNGSAEQSFPLSTFADIKIEMGGGADAARIDETNGPFTDTEFTQIIGGDGNDTLVGGSFTEIVEGGGGDDVLAGGQEFDQVRGGPGNDEFRWSSGDGDGMVEGGDGVDTELVVGSLGVDEFVIEQFPAPEDGDIRLSHVAFARVGGTSEQRLREVERLKLDAASGDDKITASAAVGRLVSLDLTAGPLGGGTDGPVETMGDDDIVIGSDEADLIRGGIGTDSLDGRGGDDTVNAGPGDDSVTGGIGFDALTGGLGADVFRCDQAGEVVDPEPTDALAALCTPASPTGSTAPAPAGAGASSLPAGDALPAGFLGFAKPRLRATRRGLRVTVANVHTAAIDVKVAVKEPFTASGRRRIARYRVAKAHIAAGARATLRLRAPLALRTQIARRLSRDGRLVRRPRASVTNVATGGTRTVRPRLRMLAR